MAIDVAVVQLAPAVQVLHYLLVGFLDELAGEGIVARNQAAQVYGLDECQFLVAAQAQVFVAKGRGDVDDAGAVFHGNEIAGNDPGGEVGSGDKVGYGRAARAGFGYELPYFAAKFRRIVKGLVPGIQETRSP